MKKSVITIITIIFIAFVQVAQTQSINEVLEKHFRTVKQDKLAKIESFYIKAKVNQIKMEMPIKMKMKKPDMFIINIDIQKQKMIQAFDGQKK